MAFDHSSFSLSLSRLPVFILLLVMTQGLLSELAGQWRHSINKVLNVRLLIIFNVMFDFEIAY